MKRGLKLAIRCSVFQRDCRVRANRSKDHSLPLVIRVLALRLDRNDPKDFVPDRERREEPTQCETCSGDVVGILVPGCDLDEQLLTIAKTLYRRRLQICYWHTRRR